MKFLGAVTGYVAVGALIAWVFQLLWNALAPMLWAQAPLFTFWQAWGVLILIRVLRGSVRR